MELASRDLITVYQSVIIHPKVLVCRFKIAFQIF